MLRLAGVTLSEWNIAAARSSWNMKPKQGEYRLPVVDGATKPPSAFAACRSRTRQYNPIGFTHCQAPGDGSSFVDQGKNTAR